MDLFMIILAVIPVVSDGFTVHSTSGPLVAPLGSSVVFPCYVDELLLMEDLKVEWRRTDSETLVHLYQDGESRPEAQQQQYHDRTHFFTDQIQHGNFSLRLDNLRAEDEGKYTCKVYSQEDSGETVVQIKDVERLIVSGSDESISVSVSEDVTLNCSVDSHIKPEHIEEVSWKKTDKDEDILVLLYQNNEIIPDSSDEQYRDRVEFFTDEIPKGNFSLKLKSVRTEDKGVYMCQVYSGGISANATAILERLGFSVSHIIVLILCISASVSALLLCTLIYYRSPNKGVIVKGPSNFLFVPLGGSVVLPCYADRKLGQFKEKLKIKWKRNNSHLLYLYEDCDNQPKVQQQYHDRAHFFTDEIQHGNFSLRLDNLRAEDKGEYTCEVFRNSDLLISDSAKLELKFTEGRFFHPFFALGSSVVLPSYVDKPLPMEGLKLEWRRTGSDTLVHLYQDGESRPEAQQQYHDRAHFFTDEIQHGNYSLRLDNLRVEDEGKYECKIYSKGYVHSTIKSLVLGFTVQRSDSLVVPLGGSVVLPCYVDPLLRTRSLKVEWKNMHTKTLVHLYQDGESRPQQDYHDRAHFFTDEIQHGNFSLRLENVRGKDKGVYRCNVQSDQGNGFSVSTKLSLRPIETFLHLQMLLVFCPNIMLFLAFVLWGVSEGFLNETITCCTLYILRPLMLFWAAPYAKKLPGNIKTWILNYSFDAEYVVFTIVVYSGK